jgi:hypothetical protein
MMTVAAIVAKLVLFLMNLAQEQMAMFTIFVNLFVVLFGSFFIVRDYKINHPGSNVKSEVKAGMKGTTMFALMLSLFVLIYYNYIDTHYFPNMIADRVELARAAMEQNPDINLENVRQMGEMMFSPRTHATLTLFGLTAVGAIYCFLIAILMRRLPGFK